MQMKPSIYGKDMNNKVIQSTIINGLKLYKRRLKARYVTVFIC